VLCAETRRRVKILWLMATLPFICVQSSALPVSEGKMCHQKVALETSLCDNDNGDGINRRLRGPPLKLRGDAGDPNQQFSCSGSNCCCGRKKNSADNVSENKKFSKGSAACILCIHTPLIWQGELGQREMLPNWVNTMKYCTYFPAGSYTHALSHLQNMWGKITPGGGKPSCKHYAFHIWPLCFLSLPGGIT